MPPQVDVAVDPVIAEHFARTDAGVESRRLYAACELEAAGVGVTAGTIRGDRTRDRGPDPDDTEGGVNRWYGATAAKALKSLRATDAARKGGVTILTAPRRSIDASTTVCNGIDTRPTCSVHAPA